MLIDIMGNTIRHLADSVMLLMALSFLSFVACSSDPESPIPEIKPGETEIVFSQTAGTEVLSVQSNVTLEVKSSDESWCTVTQVNSASATVYKYNVTVTANPDTGDRFTKITLKGGTVTETVTVKQLGSGESAPNGITGDDPRTVAKSLGLGWNLGNQMDAHSNGVANETVWGNPKATQTLFDKLAEAGITSVRIPVTWMGHIGNAPGYEIEKAWLDRVEEIVGYAGNAGLNAIVNIHHDGADGAYWLSIKNAAQSENNNTLIKAQLKAVWTQIAERFKDKGNFLAFESMNEIHDGGWGWGDNLTDGGKQYSILNEWNQLFVDAVREVGGENSNRFLGVPGYCTNPELTVNHFKLPADETTNRLMVSVHFYDPYEYTLNAKFSEWGHTGASGEKETYGDEDNVRKVFASLETTYINKGIPVYIGEMGCVRRSVARDESFRKYYLEYVCKAAKDYGMAPFYWDNGATGSGREQSGLFNRATGGYVNNGEDVVEVMKKGVLTEETSYTLQWVYDNSAPE